MSYSSIWPTDRILSGAITSGQSRSGSDGSEVGTLHSPKIQHYWSLTIRLFSVISRTLVGESYPSAEMQSVCSTAPADLAYNALNDIVNVQNSSKRSLLLWRRWLQINETHIILLDAKREKTFNFFYLLLLQLFVSTTNDQLLPSQLRM